MAGYIGTKAVALSTTTGNILGDMTVGGTTDVATLEFNSLSGTGSVTITDILDEDNLASNSATKLATQQSIKAYVDSQVDTVDTLAEILAIGNRTSGTGKIEFRDAAIFINSSTDGQLDLVADTEIQIAATTIDVNGNLDVSGTTVSAGNLLVGRTGNLAGARTLVAGTKSGTNGTNGQLVVLDEQGFGTTDNGGGLSFAGNFYNGGQVVFSTVQGVKENNTDANNAGALKFTTKAHGGNQVEVMRISSGGNVGIKKDNTAIDTRFHIDQCPDNKVITFEQSGRKMAMGTFFSSGSTASRLDFFLSNGNQNGGNNNKMSILSGGGITFNGDTAAANALDDYEEGTYNPTSPHVTFAQTDGNYTKVGNFVNLAFRIVFPSSSSGTQARMNLPFTVLQSGGNAANAHTHAMAVAFTTFSNSQNVQFGGLSNAAYGEFFSGSAALSYAQLSGKQINGTVTFLSA